ncbi:MAG TPA: putative ABC exporter domain-containing protein, partial [Myxococcaceae bacterium]|nr:putative ABC exporter domain-containing protein [Myxococcaceae bacterium]
MNLLRAFALLFGASLKNRVRRQIQRLRQPRFLIATVVGLFYFWQVIFRRWLLFTQPVGASPLRELAVGYLRPFAEMALVGLGLFQVLGAWAFGDERAQLAFTEAEVHFFFTAPASRLALVHYKLLRGLLLLLFGAVVTAAFIGRAVSQHAFLFTIGAWVALTTTSLHRIAGSFTRERLAKRGWWGSALVWALLGATVLTIAYGVQSTLATQGVPTSAAEAAALARHLMDAPPVSWIVFPIRLLVRPMLATDLASFLRAIPAALGVLAVQYVWLILTVTPFEEASAEAAELRAQMIEARRTRTPTGATLTFRRAPWSLAGTGRPETALAWKNGLA